MTDLTIYSIGHGRHPFKDFLALLQKHDIRFVCDVRTAARSRWPQYNGSVLRELLNENGIGYEHLPEAGGKRKPQPGELEYGIDRIIEIASEVRTAFMCSESRPLTTHKVPRANCHRVGLLSPLIAARGLRIRHIVPDGDTVEFDESSISSIW